MSSISSLPILSVSYSPTSVNALERDVDRNLLAAISPDRDELLLSKKPIEELRQVLKIRVGGKKESHWLYKVKQRTNLNSRDATARTSTLIHRVNDGENKASAIRRVLSTSSLNRAQRPFMRIRAMVLSAGPRRMASTCGELSSSAQDQKLISPRPLGPTHILVVYSDSLTLSQSVPRHATFLDIPINDLLFLMSASNVQRPATSPPQTTSPSPAAQASLFSKLSGPKLASSASSVYSVDTVSSGFSGHSSLEAPERSADAIAQDIVDSLPFCADEDPSHDELVSVLTSLNALKTNLAFLGYYARAVWDELDVYVAVLTRALVLRASLTEPEAN
ncbi:hypothetical protein FB45DRAFT_1022092 [Roridomyces roridus]|uniref:Uncharacterized protein n=1 Tax=Roridomyces roridus TaxID=1738132 RepID=A0AAD7C7E2_9AGAR|nr:hypothetical protein FB45DRAFT_1022092 [Roridomyces roridus]